MVEVFAIASSDSFRSFFQTQFAAQKSQLRQQQKELRRHEASRHRLIVAERRPEFARPAGSTARADAPTTSRNRQPAGRFVALHESQSTKVRAPAAEQPKSERRKTVPRAQPSRAHRSSVQSSLRLPGWLEGGSELSQGRAALYCGHGRR